MRFHKGFCRPHYQCVCIISCLLRDDSTFIAFGRKCDTVDGIMVLLNCISTDSVLVDFFKRSMDLVFHQTQLSHFDCTYFVYNGGIYTRGLDHTTLFNKNSSSIMYTVLLFNSVTVLYLEEVEKLHQHVGENKAHCAK